MDPQRPEATSPPASRAVERQLRLAAGLLCVLVAAAAVAFLVRVSGGAFWAPLVGWLLAGLTAGAIVRKRAPAVVVAAVTTIAAGVVTSLVNVLQADTGRYALKHLDAAAPPTLSSMVLATLSCTLACVLGAAAVVEVHRQFEHRRRR